MSQAEDGGKLPKTFKPFVQRFPELGARVKLTSPIADC